MPNRRQSPPIFPIRSLALPKVTEVTLDNGLPVYCLADTKQEVLKLEWVFQAGRPFERGAMVARQTQLMLRAGSRRFSREAMAEKLDFLGSSLSLPFHLDTAQVAVYGLRKHLPQITALLADMLQHPTFPQQELVQLGKRQAAHLSVELEKNEVLAYRQITELLFGPHHPYGYNSTREGYAAMHRQQLADHHERLYHPGNAQLFIGGNIQEADMRLLNQSFGQQPARPQTEAPYLPAVPPLSVTRQIIPGGSGVQSAIRLGRRLFRRDHPDYAGVYVLNTVLGGYFGSRLMTNIREEKGLTYNIHSSLDTMRYDGMWLIGCEVSPEHASLALREIEHELDRLRTDPIPAEELEMVRNYLLGTILTMLDGPLNTMDLLLTFYAEKLPPSFFNDWVDTIIHITPEQLLHLARQYLQPNDWVTLLVEAQDGKTQ